MLAKSAAEAQEAKENNEPPLKKAAFGTAAEPLQKEATSIVKPGPEGKASDKQQEQAQKWQEEFGKKSLDMICTKWNDQLVRNKREFEETAGQLQSYELKLLRQIKAIE